MEEVFPDTNPNGEMSIDRCRELLADEAVDHSPNAKGNFG